MIQNSIQKVRPILTTKETVQLYLTEEFENKCRHLCNIFPEREWSGMLFYRVRDVNIEIDKFVVDVVDFFPMSVNSKAHTDFQYDAEYVEYLIDNDLTDCYNGLIHSHNSFGVFFSGEDMSELQDNTGNHSFYLSLIVNNKFDVMAKICTIVKTPKSIEKAVYNDITGKPKEMSIENEETEYLYAINCVINKPTNTLTFNKSWLDQLDIIIEKDKKTVIPVKTVGQSKVNFGEYGDPWDDKTWNSRMDEVVTVRSLKEFVIEEILESSPKDSIHVAAKDYDHIDYGDLVKDIIASYDAEFGKTDIAEEITMLQGIVNILDEVKKYPEISKLIKMLRAAITFRQKQN